MKESTASTKPLRSARPMKTDRPVPSKLKPASRHASLPPEKLRWRCNPDSIKAKTSAEIKPSREIIGQERALRALRLGLAMNHFGYNIFVTGLSGTGRTTTVFCMCLKASAESSAIIAMSITSNTRTCRLQSLFRQAREGD